MRPAAPKRPRPLSPAGRAPKRAHTTDARRPEVVVDLTGAAPKPPPPPGVVDLTGAAQKPRAAQKPPGVVDLTGGDDPPAPALPKGPKPAKARDAPLPPAEAGSSGRARTLATLARELGVGAGSVRTAVALLDEGNTVPFIARYRKEATGSLDDAQLRTLSARLEALDATEERRTAITAALEAQGVLEGELARAVQEAATTQRLEDLYLPYRPKRTTRASAAKDRGLGPLAELLVCPTGGAPPEVLARPFVGGKDVPDVAAALAGARDIIAEQAAEMAEVREHARRLLRQRGALVSKRAPPAKAVAAKKGKGQEAAKGGGGGKDADPATYQQYFDFRCPVARLQHHQVLAINRGESNGALSVSLEWDVAGATAAAEHQLLRARGPRDGRPLPRGSAAEVTAAVADGVKRLLRPAVEREARAAATEAAAEHAVRAFGVNLRSLLLQPPLKGRVVLGVDPAFRTGCKLAAIDTTGAVLETGTVYPHPPAPQDRRGAAPGVLRAMLERHGVGAVAIGNGTASRETEQFVAAVVEQLNRAGGGGSGAGAVGFSVVNEAGASVYSASELASKELPGMDVSLRGAVSIARRLQDPLAELVKIEPRHIGVGLYQHSLQGKRLTGELDGVVEAAVNDVGVDLNTGSPALLAHVAGLKQAVADKVVAHRTAQGAFTSRAQLLKVKGLGARTFEQCAGFLRVPGAPNALDATGVHPESYPAAVAVARRLLPPGAGAPAQGAGRLTGAQLEALRPHLERLLMSDGYGAWARKMAEEAGVGEPTMRDIAAALAAPGRDIRGAAAEGSLRTGAGSVDDVREGMEFTGTVRNVVAFGAFVDIGVGKDALLHVSALRGRGATPADVLAVGQVVQVRVSSLDKARGRIGVSLADG